MIFDPSRNRRSADPSLAPESEELPVPEPASLPLPWIVRLRYGLIAGEAALAAVFHLGLQIDLPWALLASALGAQTLSTAWLGTRNIRTPGNVESIIGVLFCLDSACLTLLLAATGGPANPFSVLYLVQITFSAVILPRLWTWLLGVISTLSFGLLFWISADVPALQMHLRSGEISLHLLGMWIAFATAALLISFFVGKVSAEARQKGREVLLMQRRLARNERLASLVTLSAGAAHEIATPLSTIAVTAKEIEHHAAAAGNGAQFEEDARLIRSEVERCRLILERMGAQGADPLGEAPARVAFQDLLSRVRDRFPQDRSRIRISVDESGPTAARLPERAAIEALAALVKNALDASPGGEAVSLQAAVARSNRVRFTVQDQGAGMTPEVLERVSEPFFTTKAPGKGMGLGAFLAHLFAQRLGGELVFESQPGRGSTVVLELPADCDVR